MQTPTSGVAPDDEDVAPLLDEDELLQPLLLVDPLEELQPLLLVVEPLLEDHPLDELVEPEEEVVEPEDELLQPLLLVVEPLDDEVPHPSPTHGTPRMPTSPPATRATQTRPGLHLCSALHS
jgi:hypothetical protein